MAGFTKVSLPQRITGCLRFCEPRLVGQSFLTTRRLSRSRLSKTNGPVPTGWAPRSSPYLAAAAGEKGHPAASARNAGHDESGSASV